MGIGLLFVSSVFGQDTLNQLDLNFYRHGFWMIKSDNTPAKDKKDKVYMEGEYEHGFKTGLWLTYFNDTLIKKENYTNNKPQEYIQYDLQGNTLEEGILNNEGILVKGVRFQYDLKKKGEDKLISITYLGKNYKIIEGEYFDPYYECWFIYKDSLGKYYTFPSSDCNQEKLKLVKPPIHCDPNNLPVSIPIKKPETLIHNPYLDGRVNKKQIDEDGEFKDGKLWNGKKYVYDKNGLLDKIEIYKEGKYVGDAQID